MATRSQPSSVDDVPRTPSADDIAFAKASRRLDVQALNALFLDARTANAFVDRAISHELLEEVVTVASFGPTSANSLPSRLVFVETPEGKERLRPALDEMNVEKTMAAPVTAIFAADLAFHERFHQTFPERAERLRGFFGGMPEHARRAVAWDNALLQMAYFVIAARALGLDAGPMAGFSRELVDAAFFPDGRYISQYLVNLGYADDAKTFPRLPRLVPSDIVKYA